MLMLSTHTSQLDSSVLLPLPSWSSTILLTLCLFGECSYIGLTIGCQVLCSEGLNVLFCVWKYLDSKREGSARFSMFHLLALEPYYWRRMQDMTCYNNLKLCVSGEYVNKLSGYVSGILMNDTYDLLPSQFIILLETYRHQKKYVAIL